MGRIFHRLQYILLRAGHVIFCLLCYLFVLQFLSRDDSRRRNASWSMVRKETVVTYIGNTSPKHFLAIIGKDGDTKIKQLRTSLRQLTF
jgi:hypothetical protein